MCKSRMEKSIKVSEWTWKQLWSIRFKEDYKSVDEVIKDLLNKRKGGQK